LIKTSCSASCESLALIHVSLMATVYVNSENALAHNKTCEPRKNASQRRTTTPSHAKPACDGDPGSVLRHYAIVRTIWGTLSLEQLEPYSLVEYGVYLFPPPVRAASTAMLTGSTVYVNS